MDLFIHKKKFTAVASCTLIHRQVDGTDPLHLEMFQLVEEAIRHVRKLLNTFSTSIIKEYV
jgi:hypothetical protein